MMLLDASLFNFKWQHLRIRPIQPCDMDLYVKLYTNERIMQHIGTPLSLQKATASFQSALKLNCYPGSERLFLAVIYKHSLSASAISSISHLDRKNKIAELGSMVLPQFHGKQLGQNATVALMGRIREVLAINQFKLKIHPENLPAIRAAKLLGFRANESDFNQYMLTF